MLCFGDSGVFRIEGPAFATTSSTLSLCFQKLDPSAGTEGSNPVASSGESIQTRLSAEDTQYPFVAADSIQAAALPCWLILWSSARPLVNAAGPGKISDDLISYTSWCCVAGFRLKPGRAALVQAGNLPANLLGDGSVVYRAVALSPIVTRDAASSTLVGATSLSLFIGNKRARKRLMT